MKSTARSLARILSFTALAALLFFFSACPRPRDGGLKPTASITPLPDSGLESLPSPLPGPRASVAYLEGRVEARREGRTRLLDIGDELSAGDTLSTAAGASCEINLGKTAVIRLEGGTIVSLNVLLLEESRSRVDMSLAAGSLLSKVERLLNANSFVLRTPSMVCGVRGTAFLLRAEESGASLLAVKEGRVKALPASAALDRIATAAQSSALARSVLGGIITLGPEVGAGQELSYGGAELPAVSAIYKEIEDSLASLPPESLEAAQPLAGIIPAQDIASPSSANAKALLARVQEASKRNFGKATAASEKTKVLFNGFELMGKEGRGRPQTQGKPGASPKPDGAKPAPTSDPSILGLLPGSGSSAVGGIVQFKGLTLVSDSSGRISAYDSAGELAWRSQTSTTDARLSSPVVFKDKIYYLGPGGLDILNGSDGRMLASSRVEPPDGRLDGMRPYQFPDGILSVSESGIDILDPESGKSLDSLDVPEGLMMAPAAKKKLIVYVTATGVFRLVDSQTKQAIKEIPTQASGLSPLSLRNRDNLYFFADSQGMAVLIDIDADEPLWQKQMDGAVTSESELGRSAIYLSTTEGLCVIDVASGEVLTVIQGITGPPLLSGDQLFLCSSAGELIVAHANPYTELTRIRLPFVGSARPLIIGKTLWVAGKGGQIVRIDPELLKKRSPAKDNS